MARYSVAFNASMAWDNDASSSQGLPQLSFWLCQIFASFLTHLVNDFVNFDPSLPSSGPKCLPRLFGRLLLLLAVKVPSLTAFMGSDVLPTLLRHSVELEVGSVCFLWVRHFLQPLAVYKWGWNWAGDCSTAWRHRRQISLRLIYLFLRHLALYRQATPSASSAVWNDTITWKGISSCFTRLWCSAEPSIKRSLQALLCELPR